jgi:hypothetical protein
MLTPFFTYPNHVSIQQNLNRTSLRKQYHYNVDSFNQFKENEKALAKVS